MDINFIKLKYLDFIEELFIKLLCRISQHWRNNVLNVYALSLTNLEFIFRLRLMNANDWFAFAADC